MNLKNIFEAQKKLDNAIYEAHKYNAKEIFHKRILALFVEIGELANEISSFKYWKKNITCVDSKILEEYADGIHFLTSLSLAYSVEHNIDPIIYTDDVNISFLKLYESISEMYKVTNKDTITKTFAIYLGIAKLLNYTDKQVEDSYFAKNKINYERIKNNY